jgi:hypothetical protein
MPEDKNKIIYDDVALHMVFTKKITEMGQGFVFQTFINRAQAELFLQDYPNPDAEIIEHKDGSCSIAWVPK